MEEELTITVSDETTYINTTEGLIIFNTRPEWECRWHGNQGDDSGLQVLGDNFCSMCLHKLLMDKLYPMTKKNAS